MRVIAIGVALISCCFVALSVLGAIQAQAAQGSLRGATMNVSRSEAQAANCKGKASVKTLFNYGWANGTYHDLKGASSSAYDVTGDARADKIEIKVVPLVSDEALASAIQVWVNGRLSCSVSGGERGIDQASVRLITLKNNKPLLFVSAFTPNGALQSLYYCQGSKFVNAVGNELMNRVGASNAYISSVKPSGNRVIVQFEFSSTVTGLSRTSFTYTWKDGKLSRTSNTTSALRFAATSTGGYTKQKRKVAQAFWAYSSASLKGSSFRVPAGKVVRPLAVRLTSDGLAYRIQYGSKLGWVACPAAGSPKSGRLLSGTYGSVPLSASVPAYSTTRALGASALQKLDNYSLFIARNEVYAHHGLAFSSDELRSYFASKDWYRPNPGARIRLSKTESKNVALMLSIEKNRKSPYVS